MHTVIKTRACAARLSVLEWRHYASYSLMQLNCCSSSVEGSSLSSSKSELGRNKTLNPLKELSTVLLPEKGSQPLPSSSLKGMNKYCGEELV